MKIKRLKQQSNKITLESLKHQLNNKSIKISDIGVITYSILTFVLAVYCAGVVMFNFRAPLNCTIDRNDFSLKSYSSIERELEKVNNAHTFLSIKKGNLELFKATYGEIDALKDVTLEIGFNKYLWFIDIFKKNTIKVKVNNFYNTNKLTKKLNKVNALLEQPTNSKLVKKDGAYNVQQGSTGTKLNIDEVLHLVSGLPTLDTINLNTDANSNLLQQPLDLENDKILQEQITFYTNIVQHRPYIRLTDKISYQLSETDLCSLIDFDFNKKIVTVKQEKVLDYVKDLYKKYYTVGNEQQFIDGDNSIRSIKGGTYGWELNLEETAQKFTVSLESLNNAITNQDSIAIDVSWQSKGYSNENSLLSEFKGERYVIVSIDKQHIWVRDNGKVIMDSSCVTGTKNKNDTPTGSFSILERRDGKFLVGDNYKTWVNKWMRLTWSGIGLHDATWRDKFGNEIFKTKGSHGCINLPNKFANQLFDWLKVGDVVFIY